MKKESEIKNKHGKLSNLCWAIRNMWKMERSYLLYTIPGIPIEILTGLAASYFPKLLIDMLGRGDSFSEIAVTSILFLNGVLILTLIDSYSRSKCDGYKFSISSDYQQLKTIKQCTIDWTAE